MDTQQPTPTSAKPPASFNKIWIAAGVILLCIGIYLFSKPSVKTEDGKEEKTEAVFHRDEPTKDQIYQDDYEEKIQEMLDSGKSVREISKETGIRLDEVRKIKKRAKAETKQPSIK